MISSLKVKDLKAELQKKGRRMTGNKDVLASRLKEAIVANVPVSKEASFVPREAA